MTMRLVIPLVLTFLLSSTFASLNAQTPAPPRDDVEGQLRAYGTRVRLFESVVLKRLDEIKPKGKEATDLLRRQNQEMVVLKATKDSEQAGFDDEVAEVALKEYDDVYKQQMEIVERESALAKANLVRAKNLLVYAKGQREWPSSNLMFRLIAPLAAELQVKQAQFTVEKAETNLVNCSNENQVKELQAEWHKAVSKALQMKSELIRAKDTLDQINREIAHPPKLSDAEMLALNQFNDSLQLWKKIVAQQAAFKGEIQAKREAFTPRFVDLERSLEAAEQSWDDALELRMEAQHEEVESRVRDNLGTKPTP